MSKANVVFASLTGNNEQVAEIIVKQLAEKGVAASLLDISQTDPSDLSAGDLLVVVPYTDGEGDLPEEGLDFYDDLAETQYPKMVFGVAGSGDKFYKEDYCKAVTDFDHQLAKTGATRGAEPLFIDLDPDEDDEKRLAAFTNDLLTTVVQTKNHA